ncbi:MAG: Flp pilus assembly complex ATPase component TadA [Clostridia bacterium]|nr:Flp pilus assembly complex ATPase component TadA [Clostridia bacterium]
MINFVDYYIHYTERLRHINNAVRNAPAELIRQMEGQYAKRVNEIADFVMSTGQGRKLIMLSGPSSSGKTTTANMLVSRVKASGANAVCLSLDDFFKGEGKAPLLPDGKYDYESVYALDIDLMKHCLTELLEKGSTMMPRFDFASKGPAPERYLLHVGENDVIIVEGIHALNPIVTDCLPADRMIKIYISIKQGIKEGDDTVISAHQIRFLRRLVRDYQFRSSPPERTFEMWPQVLRGEKLYISAYKRLATVTINSIHIYEVNAIADKAIEILGGIPADSPYYEEAQEYIKRLALFENLDEGLIPENSLIREFIGQGRLSDKPTDNPAPDRRRRVIKDIRFFAETSADGLDLRRDCRYCCPRRTLAATERLVLALREQKFTLPDIGRFAYLYINYTTRLPEGHSEFIPELPMCGGEEDWFRFVDVGVSRETYDALGEKSGEWYLQSAVNIITTHFCHIEDERTAVYRILDDILAQGSDFRVLYRKKEAASATACVYVAISDDFRYIPTVIVTDKEGNILLQKQMDEEFNREDFENRYGSLLVNKTRVLIRPRKNESASRMNEINLPIGEE